MKKRLRKKRRLDEFQELGFGVEVNCAQGCGGKVLDGLIDLAEERGIGLGGGGLDHLKFGVQAMHGNGKCGRGVRFAGSVTSQRRWYSSDGGSGSRRRRRRSTR